MPKPAPWGYLHNVLAAGSHRLSLTGSNQIPNQHFGITAPAPLLRGDYDRNGSVQEADHQFWRTNFDATSGTGLQADGNGNNIVDAADYVLLVEVSASGRGRRRGQRHRGAAEPRRRNRSYSVRRIQQLRRELRVTAGEPGRRA